MASPCPGTYWVVPGQLLAGTHPGDDDAKTMDTKLEALLDAGIGSVVNLVGQEPLDDNPEDTEEFPAYEDRLEKLAEGRGTMIEIIRYAIRAGGTPTEEEMALILDSIDAEIDGRNSPTYVHCSDGAGRTGLVVGCYLARHSIAIGKEALAKIHELRAGDPQLAEHRSPGNIVQERMVTRWKPAQ